MMITIEVYIEGQQQQIGGSYKVTKVQAPLYIFFSFNIYNIFFAFADRTNTTRYYDSTDGLELQLL